MNKQIIIVAISLLLCLGIAHAAATFVKPGAGAVIQGNYVFNVSSTLSGLDNCSVTGSSALTGDSLSATWLLNRTGNTTNRTIATANLEDASDWTFSGTCYNATGSSEAITARSSIIVDNTVPTAPTTFSPSSSTSIDSIAYSVAVTGSRTTACTMVSTSSFHTQTDTMTHTGDACTATISLPGAGLYTVTVTATDGRNTSSSSSELDVNAVDNGGSYTVVSRAETTDDAEPKDNTTAIIGTIAVGAVAYMVLSKSGGSKRRRR